MNQQHAQAKAIKISREQLPLHCPNPKMALWNNHPRVYLPIESTGTATCPYCGTRYILETAD